jgi:hypothetical protein
MVYLTAVHAITRRPAAESSGKSREWLYKADYPRAIDEYIDFFGDGEPAEVARDRCGDLFLESLA